MGNSKIVYYGETLIDLTGDTVAAAQLRSGITAHDKAGDAITGTLADATQATPSITVSAAGLITASATQTAGVVAAGTKSATKQLTVQAAKTVTPSTSSQTAVARGRYTTGAITVGAVYAVIGVTYPSGSTVTCTNGTKTLTAKDTTGTALFVIPSTGTWTVTAVNGSQSTSKSVSITTEGQLESVTLSFELVLFSGSETWTLKQRTSGYGSKSISNNAMTLTGDKYYGSDDTYYACSAFYPSKVAKSSYTTLKATVTAVTGSTYVYLMVQTDMTANKSGEGYTAYVNISGTGTFSVPYPDGSYYVGLTVGGSSSVTVTKVWLE